MIEIWSVPVNTLRNVAENDSVYRSNDNWSVAIVRKMSGLYPKEYQTISRTGIAKNRMNSNHAGIARPNRQASARALRAPPTLPAVASASGSGSRGGLRLVPDLHEATLGLVHGAGVHRGDLRVVEEHEVEEAEASSPSSNACSAFS